MSKLPNDYTREIAALEREVLKHQPSDVLQFCSNFFHRRLESQRAEFHLQQRHHSGAGGANMAESTFPGSNPFGSSNSPSGAPAVGGGQGAGMHSLREEDEEHDFASPTQSSFPPRVRGAGAGEDAAAPHEMDNSNAPNGGGAFSNFGGFGAASSNSNSSTSARNTTNAMSSQAMDSPQSFPSNYNMGRRTSVSAESLAPAGADDSNWKAPSYPKTAEQVNRLRSAVAHNFLFSHLDDEQSSLVLGALQERKVPAAGVRVIVQGDAGDYFYVVESGSFDIYVSKTGRVEVGADGMGTKVASSGPGTSFGELALMYNAPRAATVVSTEPSVVWQLDRITFRRILMDSAFQRRRMYESFLEEVPLLSSLTSYERSEIADALETQKYPAGTTIIREGDVGDKFYILESGEAEAHKQGMGGKVLKSYGKGDYFGELALLDDRPRAASVVARGDVKVATLGKDGFQRLLGPVEGMMRRDDPRNR